MIGPWPCILRGSALRAERLRMTDYKEAPPRTTGTIYPGNPAFRHSPSKTGVIALMAHAGYGLLRLARLGAQLLDQARDVRIGGREPPELLRVSQRRRGVSGLAVEGNQRLENVAIVRVLLQALREDRHGVAGAAGGMQRHRVDVKIARAAGLELDRPVQLVKRIGGALHAHQGQAERVMQAGVARRGRERRAQRALPLPVPAELAIEVGEIDRRRRERRAQP